MTEKHIYPRPDSLVADESIRGAMGSLLAGKIKGRRSRERALRADGRRRATYKAHLYGISGDRDCERRLNLLGISKRRHLV
jgi:hypothetical protein